jgi:hypothetical protein
VAVREVETLPPDTAAGAEAGGLTLRTVHGDQTHKAAATPPTHRTPATHRGHHRRGVRRRESSLERIYFVNSMSIVFGPCLTSFVKPLVAVAVYFSGITDGAAVLAAAPPDMYLS